MESAAWAVACADQYRACARKSSAAGIAADAVAAWAWTCCAWATACVAAACACCAAATVDHMRACSIIRSAACCCACTKAAVPSAAAPPLHEVCGRTCTAAAPLLLHLVGGEVSEVGGDAGPRLHVSQG